MKGSRFTGAIILLFFGFLSMSTIGEAVTDQGQGDAAVTLLPNKEGTVRRTPAGYGNIDQKEEGNLPFSSRFSKEVKQLLYPKTNEKKSFLLSFLGALLLILFFLLFWWKRKEKKDET